MNDNIIKLTNAFTERLKENTIVKDKLKEENANLNRENDRLNDELENLKEAYGGENAKLKEENNKLQMDSGFHKGFSFHKQEEVHKLKEELSEAKAEALEEHNIARQNNIDFHNECADYNKLKQEKVNLDKAFSKACIDIDINEISKGKISTNCIESLNTIKEHYLKEASKW